MMDLKVKNFNDFNYLMFKGTIQRYFFKTDKLDFYLINPDNNLYFITTDAYNWEYLIHFYNTKGEEILVSKLNREYLRNKYIRMEIR